MNGAVFAPAPVTLRLLRIFILLGCTVCAGIVLSNVFVSRATAEELVPVLIGTGAGYALLLALLGAFTYRRLKRLYLRSREEGERAEERDRLLWLSLIGFPRELFVFFLLSGLAVTQLYHLFEIGLPPWDRAVGVEYGKSTAFELTTFTAFSYLHYLSARWVLRPYVRELRVYRQETLRYGSSVWTMAAILALGTVYALLRMLWYAYSGVKLGGHIRIPVLLGTGAAVLTVTVTAIGLTAYYLLRDMERLGTLLRGLAGEDRRGLHSRIPVTSPYEAGELAGAFNALQDRFKGEYARLNQELALASQVQERLLPQGPMAIHGWEVHGACRRSGAGTGGFYDRMTLPGPGAAFLSGRITGSGMPSALIVSALLMLIRTGVSRTERAEGGDGLLARVHAQLTHYVPDGVEIHIGLCILDGSSDILRVELAGDMELIVDGRPYRPPSCAPLCGDGDFTGERLRISLADSRSVLLRTGAGTDGRVMSANPEGAEDYSMVKAERTEAVDE